MKQTIRVLIGVHLIVLLSGMFPTLGKSPVGRFLNGYARLTGAGSSFGFFSPDVANQLTFSFLITDSRQRQSRVQLQDLVSKETSVRLGNMFRFFTQVYRFPRIRRSVAASFAAVLFNKFPDAQEITLEAERFRLPGLKEYWETETIHREPVYRATFQRGKG